MPSGNFKRAWERISVDATTSILTEYGVLIAQALITTAYYVDRIEGTSTGAWARTVATVLEEGDEAIINDAFNKLRQGEYSEHRTTRISLRSEDEESLGVVERILEDRANSEAVFTEWLPEFEEQVNRLSESS